MNKFYRNLTKSDDAKTEHKDGDFDYFFEILLPDFLAFVIGVSFGIVLIIHIFRLL